MPWHLLTQPGWTQVFLLANFPFSNLFLPASLGKKENIKINKIKDHLQYNKNPLPQ